MRGRSARENPHRTALLRPSDISADKADQEAKDSSSTIPVADFDVFGEGANDNSPGRPHPFGDNALALHARGLVVFPCGGEDGKRPLVKWWPRPKSVQLIAKWAQRFPDANIGVACGSSRLVVVDVDRPDLVPAMLERFGDTPLISRTPSGGAHLVYRKEGAVRSTNLRSEGLDVDIKADGGMVIVPTSFNRLSGVPYEFERGSWDDLDRLPPFDKTALARPAALTKSRQSRQHSPSAGLINEGMRDNAVFAYAMRAARHATSKEDLIAETQRFNQQHCSPPLPARQAVEKARSAWDYEQRGENWFYGGGRVVLDAAEVDDLLGCAYGSDALALFVKLKRSHDARGTPFAISCGAMARDGVIAGWKTPRRYTRARKILEARRLVVQVKPPSRDPSGRCTPAKYRLTRDANNASNINYSPLCLLPHKS